MAASIDQSAADIVGIDISDQFDVPELHRKDEVEPAVLDFLVVQHGAKNLVVIDLRHLGRYIQGSQQRCLPRGETAVDPSQPLSQPRCTEHADADCFSVKKVPVTGKSL